ncbi:hypothetical protein PVA19_15515 [Agrobacterium sp. CNPSo 3708]|uniref:hypothetical protein n=1 Tax=unclassified Agrobacterium TaxID=2632611 RepID=UPI002363FBD9|nr:hypothetical protein [Agrobacterium sp. CNPSo 3708]MDD1499830.1 hypothetical protein [Agrobacterium sp. CNPSo 3708]
MARLLKLFAGPEGTGSTTRTKANHMTVGVPFVYRTKKRMQGHLFNKKLRVVCQSCNNGWMSQMEEDCRFIGRMIIGLPIILDPPALEGLATWIAMRAMVFERDDPSTAAIPRSDYRYLMEHKQPPPNWHIWIGFYDGRAWQVRFKHTAVHAATTFSVRMEPNLQSTSFGAGHLFVHAVSTTVEGVEPRPPTISAMMKIWPPRTMPLHWPLPFATDDDMANAFGYMFDL